MNCKNQTYKKKKLISLKKYNKINQKKSKFEE